MAKIKKDQQYLLKRDDIDKLFETLKMAGYKIIGPTVSDRAIVLDEIDDIAQLPIGWTDESDPANYRIHKTKNLTLFNYNVGPHSFKKYLFPPTLSMFKITNDENQMKFTPNSEPPPKYAFLGVKPCELKAIEVQDKVFINSEFIDNHYAARRKNCFIINTNCTKAASTCFCTSMESGPKAQGGFDLSLTELYNKKEHTFLISSGSEAGLKILKELPLLDTGDEQLAQADKIIEKTVNSINRTLNTVGLKQILDDNLNHPLWDDIAERCISCGNCTMVCPTCFCSNVEDVTALDGSSAERVRTWDSCFSKEYSYIHGGAVRATIKSRYRQWMTHKLAGWFDQFDISGCIGCGRCITWCPVGIDITEEARTIRETAANQTGSENKTEVA